MSILSYSPTLLIQWLHFHEIKIAPNQNFVKYYSLIEKKICEMEPWNENGYLLWPFFSLHFYICIEGHDFLISCGHFTGLYTLNVPRKGPNSYLSLNSRKWCTIFVKRILVIIRVLHRLKSSRSKNIYVCCRLKIISKYWIWHVQFLTDFNFAWNWIVLSLHLQEKSKG